MAVTYGAAGAFSSVSTATTAVAYPTGISAGNLLVLVGMPKPGATAMSAQPTISGWTSQGFIRHGTTASANDAGSMAIMVWTKTATGSETGSETITWGITPAAGQAIMYRLANATGGWSIAVDEVVRTATTTAWSVTFPTNPGLTVGDFVAVHNIVPTDLATASSAGTLTATGLTPGAATGLVAHQTDGGGSDSAHWADYYIPTAGTSSAAPTYASTLTGGTNLYGVSAIIRAREIVVAPTGVSAGADDDHLVNTAFTRTATQIGATSHAWTIQSGPAGVGSTIGTAAALSWTPTVTGTYVLRYSATNSAGTTTDDATIYVEAAAAVNDTFTRTNASDPGVADTGQEWIPRFGTWGTNGSQMYTPSGQDNDIATVLVGTTTQTIRATIAAATGFWIILGRYEAGPTSYPVLFSTDGIVSLYRCINNVYTSITATAAGTVAVGSVLELSIAEETTPTAGTRLIVKDDGVQIINTLDTAGTRPLNGIRAGVQQGNPGTTSRWDDFQVNYTGPTTSAAGAITLGGSVTATATGPSTAGAITLGGAPAGTAVATSTTGGITLGGSITPAGSASSSGTITLGGSGTPTQPGSGSSGSVTLSGSATGRAGATAPAGVITLGGGPESAQAVASTSGSVTLGGSPTATASSSATVGGVTLSGSPSGRAGAATTGGTVTLGGSATVTPPGASANGSISLGGAATGRAEASAAGGVVSLGGAPVGRAAAVSGGVVTLGSPSAAATSSAGATGSVTLGGQATVQIPGSTANGGITLSGAPSARGGASANGIIVLGGASTPRASATTGGVIVLGGAPTVAVAASVAGAIFLSGIANGVDGAVPLPVEFDITGLVSPTLGTAAAGSPTAGVTGSSPSLAVWANSPTILLTL